MQVGNNYCTLANCYQEMGDEKQALEYYQKGIKELRIIGDTSGEVVYLNNVALIYKRQKRLIPLKIYVSRLLILVQTQDIPFNKCLATGNYGDLLRELERYDEALENFRHEVV